MIRILVLAAGIILVLFYFANPWFQGQMLKVSKDMQISLNLASNADEVQVLREVVRDFMKLRDIRHTEEGKQLAQKLDQKLNDLNLVQDYCNGRVSTFDLAYEKDPYSMVQKQCPILKDVSMSKAVNLWSGYVG